MSHLNIVHVAFTPMGIKGEEKEIKRGRTEIFIAIYFVES